jgi:ribosome-associated protein
VVVLDLRTLSSVADFFVLANAVSSPQLSAMADEIDVQMRSLGERVWHVEGLKGKPSPEERREFRWVLVDCGDVVVHLLTPNARTFYQLERLWGDAPQAPLPSSAVAGKA